MEQQTSKPRRHRAALIRTIGMRIRDFYYRLKGEEIPSRLINLVDRMEQEQEWGRDHLSSAFRSQSTAYQLYRGFTGWPEISTARAGLFSASMSRERRLHPGAVQRSGSLPRSGEAGRDCTCIRQDIQKPGARGCTNGLVTTETYRIPH